MYKCLYKNNEHRTDILNSMGYQLAHGSDLCGKYIYVNGYEYLTCNKKDIEDGTVDIDKELLNYIK